MSETSNLGIEPRKKTWTRIFIWSLCLQALLELLVGLTLLFDLPTALESGFGISYSVELDVLGNALGLYLLLLTTLMIVSAMWTKKANLSGVTLGIICGVFLLTFGVYATITSGDAQALLIDGLRGFLTIAFGYMAGKEIKQQHV